MGRRFHAFYGPTVHHWGKQSRIQRGKQSCIQTRVISYHASSSCISCLAHQPLSCQYYCWSRSTTASPLLSSTMSWGPKSKRFWILSWSMGRYITMWIRNDIRRKTELRNPPLTCKTLHTLSLGSMLITLSGRPQRYSSFRSRVLSSAEMRIGCLNWMYGLDLRIGLQISVRIPRSSSENKGTISVIFPPSNAASQISMLRSPAKSENNIMI